MRHKPGPSLFAEHAFVENDANLNLKLASSGEKLWEAFSVVLETLDSFLGWLIVALAVLLGALIIRDVVLALKPAPETAAAETGDYGTHEQEDRDKSEYWMA